MNFRHWAMLVVLLVSCAVATGHAWAQGGSAQSISFISADELKKKLSRNEPVTVIDVRSSTAFSESQDKIKGAIRVKLRKLKSRLAIPPLKNVPRDSEVITYCACPSDDAAMRAAQILSEAGFKRVRALKDGWQGWLQAKGQLEPRPRLPR
ncbi:MAG TPA: rhodanese-like domain-containing protein [Pyrinomonadaceae bacterium]|nr:rhodanese-like domain-containing protein [Pyrinomonadaceae bacterium]